MLSAECCLPQLQPHLGSRLKAQRFIQRTAILTGVKIDHCQSLIPAPLNHQLHELSRNSSPPKLGVSVNIQNRGPAAFAVIGVAWPRTKQDCATGNHATVYIRQPSTKRSGRDRLREKFARSGNHAGQGLWLVVAHIYVYAFTLFENFGNIVRCSFADSGFICHSTRSEATRRNLFSIASTEKADSSSALRASSE